MKDTFTGDWPHASSHHVETPEPCSSCGELVRDLVSYWPPGAKSKPVPQEGVRCEPCHVKALPPRERRGKAMAALLRRVA